ncbi:MinD/ParA family ATP-binding protein [Actinomadura opuntiae]|uniref:MinD/ParA family ATP-binding protein n=1 Tax=Actinomadura sp. OS1-43 TaxID=604315 RepID=UPI00255B1739|nr:AAA family ATPase [Actinomadura sp. OS1-43]MDL4816866.1 AAA family ATPase [Actinomadura sp. OS1-43]
MARNEHDGRSLEERLASLDAMSGETTGPSAAVPPPAAEGEQAPAAQPAQPERQGPPEAAGRPEGAPGEQAPQPAHDPNANPWLASPPPIPGPENFAPENFAPENFGPEGFGPPPPPPGPAQNLPPYDGGPMPQPFEGGMLPPPYAAAYQPFDQKQPWETGPAPQQQPPYDAGNGQGAPPLDQLPPYLPDQPFPPHDPNAAQPPYPAEQGGAQPFPADPHGAQPFPQDPNAQPFPQDPNAQPFPQDPNGQPYAQDPNVNGQPYAVDPTTGQPYPPNQGGGQPYPVDPNTGQPYPVDPNTGRPYMVDPNTGQTYPVDPSTGQPYAVDPSTGQPYAQMPPNSDVGPPQQGYAYPQQGPSQPGPYQQVPPNQQQYPGQPQQPQQQPQPDPKSSESLSSENLLGERRIAPSSGWRRAVYKATGGSVHPGESQSELRRKDLIARARTPVTNGHHRVAVMSLKGGVGKTTTTTGLGSMLGSLRGDRVIAVDANPDRGTLSDKVRLETAATVRDLLNSRDRIHRYADVRAFTSQNPARLEVLASDRDPAVSEAFSAEDYAAVAVVLEQYYSVCITDCGTGLLHSAMAGVLSLADQLVLVSSPSVDGARSASATLDWLEAHDHGHLVRNGVVVLSMVRNRTRSQVDLDKLQAHFESRCRAVVRIPYDDHLEEGAEVELEQLAQVTREAYLNLAAIVGDGFAYPRPDRPS